MMDNNVTGRIDDYLDQVFGPYEDSPTVAELRLEIRHDLLERLTDLTEHGVGDEVAYAQVISAVGDIEPMIRDLVEQDRAEETGEPSATPEPEATPPTTPDVPPAAQFGSPDPASQPSQPEPEGPAGTIPDGDTPGTAWRPGSAGEDGYEDWSAVADAVAAGLDSVRTQVSGALQQVEDALNRAGLGYWTTAVRHERDRQRDRERDRDWAGRWRQEERFSRISYAASNLRGADFHGQQMPGSNFAASSMRGSDFSGAVLTGSKLASCDLRNSNFTGADLSGSNLASCSLRGAQFDRANLTEVKLTSSDLRHVAFTGTNLTRVRANFADLRGTTFADTALEEATFTGSDLRGATFNGLALNAVRFDMANLTEATFRGCRLTGVSFHHVPARTLASIVFEDTTIDQATLLSMRSTGYVPQGVRVEN